LKLVRICCSEISTFCSDEVFEEKKTRVPIIVSITIETTGTMLMGTDISAALTTFETLRYH
jgi:methionine synthase I (cobalamin-dependent)